ncbi:hypothetical protein BGX38DRAFT_1281481 [Terfezia claveryi]|nr:hypothetical protein BGX38DRAFT_1281481 [Terfezia claveryi]
MEKESVEIKAFTVKIGGLDREWKRVSRRVERMVTEKEREWVKKDRRKKRECVCLGKFLGGLGGNGF